MVMQTENSTTILLIDDNPTNLGVLYDTLSQYGYEIFIEMDGKSGIEQADKILPDLILLDVMMPGIDGFETCRQLKESPLTEDIPIIFMTALSDTVDKVKGLQLGAVDYITKPFKQEEVLARIQAHLKLRQVTLELEQEKLNLEVNIQERTADLKQALEELKETQLQLIQNEKMSSLGQLVAGIAHEINNPINFITGNINHWDDYTQDLLNIVKFCQQKYSTDPELSEMIADIDLDFILQDLPSLVSSMKIGSKRISEIVTSLRNFSRLGEADVKQVNIQEGIDSTLLILKNRLNATMYRPEIQVIKNYDNLPLVQCHAGQINQVLMSILSNAIDALDEKEKPAEINDFSTNIPTDYQIKIQTKAINSDWISIKIRDNAKGMSEAIKSKIFDPFFTTKSVGKGTGLGLSISYKIITEKHHGKLLCLSEPGKGTEFIIEIPVVSQFVKLNNLPLKKYSNKISESVIQQSRHICS
ncbi:MAG: response regulator [Microcoleaceae cyanobacterium]